MQSIYVISAITENTMRVLQRMAGIFSRQRLNIEQLTVFETGRKGLSCFNIVVHSDARKMERTMHQLRRIVELMEVNITSEIPLINSVPYSLNNN